MLANQIKKITYNIFLWFNFCLPDWTPCGLFSCDHGGTVTEERCKSSPTVYVCVLSPVTFCRSPDCSPPVSSILGIFQARIWNGLPFLLEGIFLIQGSNPYLLCFLPWQADSLPLSHLGNPILKILVELGGQHLGFLPASPTVPLKEKGLCYSVGGKLHEHRINSKGGIPLAISNGKKEKQVEDVYDNLNRKPKVESSAAALFFCHLSLVTIFS